MSEMITVEARLSQLSDAADAFDTSSEKIDDAVDKAHDLIEGLIALGFQSPAAATFMNRYHKKAHVMNEWPVQLRDFSQKLRSAVEDITEGQKAKNIVGSGVPTDPGIDVPPTSGPGVPTGGNLPDYPSGDDDEDSDPHSGSPSGGHGRGRSDGRDNRHDSDDDNDQLTDIVDDVTSDDNATPTSTDEDGTQPDGFVSDANMPLYNELQQTKTDLTTAQTDLEGLQATRDQRDQLLADMKLRYETSGVKNAATEDAIKQLEEQVTGLDQQIAAKQGDISTLQSSVDDLATRLNTVAPTPGADLELIAGLQNSTTSQAILNATRQADNSVNCVNYICNRMTIPPGIPNNAYLWVDNANHHPEYGITVSDVPRAGSVIVMQPDHSYANDAFGHVMYVERVDPDGSVWITDNNYPGTPVKLQDLTSELTGGNIQYLYFPWETQA